MPGHERLKLVLIKTNSLVVRREPTTARRPLMTSPAFNTLVCFFLLTNGGRFARNNSNRESTAARRQLMNFTDFHYSLASQVIPWHLVYHCLRKCKERSGSSRNSQAILTFPDREIPRINCIRVFRQKLPPVRTTLDMILRII